MISIAPDLPPSTRTSVPSVPALSRFLNRARTAIGLPGTVSVLLTSDGDLKRLNRTFRSKNKPTDILSFPADPIPGLPSAHQHAGDLAISLETAAHQAAEHGHTLADELRILLLHGLLHLSGLDHEIDSGQMAARESALRDELRLPNTLIARTQTPLAAPAAKPPRSPRSPSPRTTNKPPSSRPKSSQSEDAAERPLYFSRTTRQSTGRPQAKQTIDNSQRRTLP